jgi:transcriptional regulator of NAD metabolism
LISPIFFARLVLLKERKKMISTAIALQDATKDAVHDEMVMNMAATIYHHKDEMTSEEFVEALYRYSAMLSALTTTLVTSVLLTEAQMNEMMDTIKEIESFGKDIENGNN